MTHITPASGLYVEEYGEVDWAGYLFYYKTLQGGFRGYHKSEWFLFPCGGRWHEGRMLEVARESSWHNPPEEGEGVWRSKPTNWLLWEIDPSMIRKYSSETVIHDALLRAGFVMGPGSKRGGRRRGKKHRMRLPEGDYGTLDGVD